MGDAYAPDMGMFDSNFLAASGDDDEETDPS